MSKDMQFRACEEIDRRACRARRGGDAAGAGRLALRHSGTMREHPVLVPPIASQYVDGRVCNARHVAQTPMARTFVARCRNPAMNYRHAFHAGGFADVIKHIVLVRMLTYLQEKPAAFRVIDTHAGAGRYDLTGEEARRGGEWLTGIARVMQARFSESALPLVTPYLDIVRAFNPPARARGLSRIAADRPRAAAAAGPPHGLRDRTRRPQATDRRAAPRHPGAGGRSRRLDGAAGLRAAERAARPGADRSAVRAKGRIRAAGRRLRRSLREMADRQLSDLVSR